MTVAAREEGGMEGAMVGVTNRGRFPFNPKGVTKKELELTIHSYFFPSGCRGPGRYCTTQGKRIYE